MTIEKVLSLLYTTGGIVAATGMAAWGMMTWAMDDRYVEQSEFEEQIQQIDQRFDESDQNTQEAVVEAVSNIQCDDLRSELDDLDATILYKRDHKIPTGLDEVLRDQKLRALQGRSDCNGSIR